MEQLTQEIGVYILADLDNVPVYVGQSKDGIRSRVRRHLTSARSDVIANRQIDVWEIAYVWAYPVKTVAEIAPLEAALFHHFDPKSQLMNGAILPSPADAEGELPVPHQCIEVISPEERAERTDEGARLPRQASHYAQLVDHFLTVKNSDEIARAMDAHFKRLRKYHERMQANR